MKKCFVMLVSLIVVMLVCAIAANAEFEIDHQGNKLIVVEKTTVMELPPLPPNLSIIEANQFLNGNKIIDGEPYEKLIELLPPTKGIFRKIKRISLDYNNKLWGVEVLSEKKIFSEMDYSALITLLLVLFVSGIGLLDVYIILSRDSIPKIIAPAFVALLAFFGGFYYVLNHSNNSITLLFKYIQIYFGVMLVVVIMTVFWLFIKDKKEESVEIE